VQPEKPLDNPLRKTALVPVDGTQGSASFTGASGVTTGKRADHVRRVRWGGDPIGRS
jgi:hypothetical protein